MKYFNTTFKLLIFSISILSCNVIATENQNTVSVKSKNLISEQNRLFITQAFEKWASGKEGFFQEVLSPDVIWTIKGSSPAAGTYKSRDTFIEQAVAPFSARISKPLKPTVNNIWADGNDVVVYWDGVAVATDGVAYNNSYVWIFRMKNLRATEVIAFLDLTQYDDIINRIQLSKKRGEQRKNQTPNYVGIWITANGHIRHELLDNGRYDEARGNRKSAYQGRYEINNNQVDYWDDTGFTADGVFVDENTLHHAGMVFHRKY